MISPRKLVGLILVVISLFVAAGAVTAFLVAHGAEEIAGSEPFCIQISDGTDDYRPARSWLDLSIFTTRAKRDGPLYMQHHAILVVGESADPRLYHWSYRRHAFVPGVLNERIEHGRPALTCEPARDFGRKRLALFPGSPSDSNYIRYSTGETYLIPSMWQPQWRGGRRPTLLLATTAPDFRPLERRWSDLAPGERDSNWVFVEWNPEWVLSIMKADPGETIVERGTEHGLAKTKSVTHGRDGKQYVGFRYHLYADESLAGSRINTTVISCGEPSEAFPKSCQHRFINKGRDFYFRHRPQDVPDWQGMQQRILDVMGSFEVHRLP